MNDVKFYQPKRRHVIAVVLIFAILMLGPAILGGSMIPGRELAVFPVVWAQDIDEELDEDIDEEAEQDLEEDIDSELEDELEEALEEEIDSELEEEFDEEIEADIDEEMEDDLEDEIEDDTEDTFEEELEDALEDETEEVFDDEFDQEDDGVFDKEEHDDERSEDTEPLDDIELTLLEDEALFGFEIDDEGGFRIRDRHLILTDSKSVEALKKMGFEITDIVKLKSLDSILVEIVEPDGVALEDVRKATFDLLERSLDIDYDHLYQPQSGVEAMEKKDRQPRALLNLELPKNKRVKLGLVDSAITSEHKVFQQSNIVSASFIQRGLNAPTEHGTAIASILCGRADDYQGLFPEMELYAASVFFNDVKVGQRASVKGLVLALDWLVQQNVSVVNMSLTGPDNRVLEAVLKKLHRRGILIVAAVGNSGPAGKVLFPAGYDFVVSVTATNQNLLAYHKANRGRHVDLAAPGVNILHAVPGGSYSLSSGTSYATPFVSAYLATQRIKYPESAMEIFLDTIFRASRDLGQPGHDPIYGHGYIQ